MALSRVEQVLLTVMSSSLQFPDYSVGTIALCHDPLCMDEFEWVEAVGTVIVPGGARASYLGCETLGDFELFCQWIQGPAGPRILSVDLIHVEIGGEAVLTKYPVLRKAKGLAVSTVQGAPLAAIAAELRHCEHLRIRTENMAAKELQHLAAIPQLSRLEIIDRVFRSAHVSLIEAMPALNCLSVIVRDLDDDLLYLANRLQKLEQFFLFVTGGARTSNENARNLTGVLSSTFEGAWLWISGFRGKTQWIGVSRLGLSKDG